MMRYWDEWLWDIAISQHMMRYCNLNIYVYEAIILRWDFRRAMKCLEIYSCYEIVLKWDISKWTKSLYIQTYDIVEMRGLMSQYLKQVMKYLEMRYLWDK